MEPVCVQSEWEREMKDGAVAFLQIQTAWVDWFLGLYCYELMTHLKKATIRFPFNKTYEIGRLALCTWTPKKTSLCLFSPPTLIQKTVAQWWRHGSEEKSALHGRDTCSLWKCKSRVKGTGTGWTSLILHLQIHKNDPHQSLHRFPLLAALVLVRLSLGF